MNKDTAPVNKDNRNNPNIEDGAGDPRAKKAEKQKKKKEAVKNPEVKKGRREAIPVEEVTPPEPKRNSNSRKGAEEENAPVKVRHEDMVAVAHVIVRVRDVNDNDPKARVQITGSDVESFKTLLIAAGYERRYVDTLNTGAMINLAEDSLMGKTGKEFEVVPAENAEEASRINERVVGYGGSVGEAVAREEIEKAQKASEEDLTVDKIGKRIEVVKGEKPKSYAQVALENSTDPEIVRILNHSVVVDETLALRSRAEAQKALDEAQIFDKRTKYKKPLVLPERWDRVSSASRAAELYLGGVIEEEKLTPIFEIGGGSTRWPDNSTVDETVAIQRLNIMDGAQANPAAYATTPFDEVDREELTERLNALLDEYGDPKRVAALGLVRQEKDTFDVAEMRVKIALRELKALSSTTRTGAAVLTPGQRDELRENAVEFLLETRYPIAANVLTDMLNLESIPAGMRSQDMVDELESLRFLLGKMMDKAKNDSKWLATDAAVTNDFTGYSFTGQDIKGGYKFAFDLTRAVDDIEDTAKAMGIIAQLDSVISESDRNIAKLMSRKMNRYFVDKVDKLPRNIRTSMFLNLEEQVDALDSASRLYGYTPPIYGFLLLEGANLTDRNGYEGTLEHHASAMAEGNRRKVKDTREGLPPKNWRESWRNAIGIIRYVEGEDLPVEDLQQAITKISQIGSDLGLVPPGADRAEADKLRERIEKLRKAVFAKVQEREVLQSSSWDPDKVADIYLQPAWNSDETHQVYSERFDEDDEGLRFKDVHGNEFNLLDKAMSLYFKDYAEDKRKLNMAEALTLMDLNRALGGSTPSEIRALFKRDLSAHELDLYERVRKELLLVSAMHIESTLGPPPVTRLVMPGDFHEMSDVQIDGLVASLTPDQRSAAIHFWSHDGVGETGHMHDVITEWMANRTLVGANSEKKIMWIDPATGTLKPKSMLEWRKHQNYLELRARLEVDLGTATDPDAKARLERYDKTLLLKQAANVAYWETYAMGAPASYGLVRIFDRKKDWYDNKFGTVKQVKGVAYNTDSNYYFSRIVDNIMAYEIDENRGKRDVGEDERLSHANAIWQQKMLGKHHGVLPQNRLLVKIARDNLRNSAEFRNKLVASGDWTAELDHAIHDLDNLDTLGHNGQHLDDDDQGLARSVAIAEMIDDGDISFENIEWSKVYKNNQTNIMKWHMADMWADRRGVKKNFDHLQNYLRAPSKENYFALMDKTFYSRRERVIHPFAKQTLAGHFELGKYSKELWGTDYNMSRAQKEGLMHDMLLTSLIDKKSEHHMMQRYLGLFDGRIPGVAPVRVPLMHMEFFGHMSKEVGKKGSVGFFLTFFWEILKGALMGGVAETKGK